MPEISLSLCVTLNRRYEPLMPQFLEMRRAELLTIEDALKRGDWPVLARIGHNLSGAGASYGLDALSPIGERLEKAAHAQDERCAKQTFALLREFLGDLRITYRNSVLFVDDQPEIIALLQRLFSKGEYICFFANSAAQALEILETQPIDVLVSDLVMPDMGGLELLSKVRARFPEVVRLVLSGQSQVPSILAAIETGQVFRYLTKPWRVDTQARAVVAEAVAHANEQNLINAHFLHIAPDVLCQLLEATGRDYLLVGPNDQVLSASSARRSEFSAGATASELEASGARCVPLDERHQAWVWG